MGAVLPKNEIKRLLGSKPPLIENFINADDQLQPNGFDLTLRNISRPISQGRTAIDNRERVLSNCEQLLFESSGWIEIPAGPYVITFNEVVNLPNDIMALAKPRSSLLRCGVAIHNAVWDAGYHGRSQALMVIYNSLGFSVEQNARVMQLVFFKLSAATEGYQGIYQNENIRR